MRTIRKKLKLTVNPPRRPAACMMNSSMICKQMTQQSSKRSGKTHKHKPLHGKDCEEAAYDPLGLINLILKGMNFQAAEDTLRQNEARANHRPIQQLIRAARSQNAKIPISKILGKCKMSRTDSKPAIGIVHDSVTFKQTPFDEYAGDVLPEGLLRAAIMGNLLAFLRKSYGQRRVMVR